MKIESLAIPDVKLLTPRVLRDERGHFAETWNRRVLAAAGIDADFVQDNEALSRAVGTVRGLHFQVPPMAQAKLVRCTKGAVLDVVVDIREGSASYGRHVAVELSAANAAQMWVPAGFAHGYVTLEPDSEVAYKVTAYYSPAHDRGLAWNDPALGIDWRLDPARAVLSVKDRRQPTLAALGTPFPQGGTL
jgi:dTDP-4-dehydrorhamnose 3,5-epimerase